MDMDSKSSVFVCVNVVCGKGVPWRVQLNCAMKEASLLRVLERLSWDSFLPRFRQSVSMMVIE